MSKEKIHLSGPIDFNHEEFSQIIEKSKELIKRGYFTGINFLQSEVALPQNSIIIHFLHDSKRQIEEITSTFTETHLVIPRFTYYILKPEYFNKLNFKEEYKNAIFLNSKFETIPIEEAKNNPENVTISNSELDLVIPITEATSLNKIIKNIKEANIRGPEPWIDPVIIIRTKNPIKTLEGFVDKHFVCIARDREEFYSVLTDKTRISAIEKYLDKLCTTTKIGKLEKSDVVFYPSQINTEFADYLTYIQNQLEILE